jgi:hypothetical protein
MDSAATSIARCACGYPHTVSMLTVVPYEDAVRAGFGGLEASRQLRSQSGTTYVDLDSIPYNQQQQASGSVPTVTAVTAALALANCWATGDFTAQSAPFPSSTSSSKMVVVPAAELEQLRHLLELAMQAEGARLSSSVSTIGAAPLRSTSGVANTPLRPGQLDASRSPSVSQGQTASDGHRPSLGVGGVGTRRSSSRQASSLTKADEENTDEDDDELFGFGWVRPDPQVPRDPSQHRSRSRSSTSPQNAADHPTIQWQQHIAAQRQSKAHDAEAHPGDRLGRRNSTISIASVESGHTAPTERSPAQRGRGPQPLDPELRDYDGKDGLLSAAGRSSPNQKHVHYHAEPTDEHGLAAGHDPSPSADPGHCWTARSASPGTTSLRSLSPGAKLRASDGRRSVADAQPLRHADLQHALAIVHEDMMHTPSPQKREDVLPFRF